MEEIQINSLTDLLHKNNKNIEAKGFFTSHTYTFLGRILLFLMGIPKLEKEKGTVILQIVNKENKKIWKRYFNGKLFQTYSNKDNKIFIEKQGAISFEFEIRGDKCNIEYLFKKKKIAGIKIPKVLSLKPYGISYLKDINSWYFDIRIYFMLPKPLIRYKGIVSLV